MKRISNILYISTFALLLLGCGSKENASRPQTGYLFVFGDDSCHCITYDDMPIFSTDNTNSSLFYNDIATVQGRDGNWGYINRKGETKLPASYERATVFSEGMAWVIKQGDMPGDNSREKFHCGLPWGNLRHGRFQRRKRPFLLMREEDFRWQGKEADQVRN